MEFAEIKWNERACSSLLKKRLGKQKAPKEGT